jgi:ABC-type antimicrobial peptide transport system permease subunit
MGRAHVPAKIFRTLFIYQYENGKVAGGRIAYVSALLCYCYFILIIACINFMNLATAKTTARIREAGIRKLVGARREISDHTLYY